MQYIMAQYTSTSTAEIPCVMWSVFLQAFIEVVAKMAE